MKSPNVILIVIKITYQYKFYRSVNFKYFYALRKAKISYSLRALHLPITRDVNIPVTLLEKLQN